ncbi:hypothetical protein CR513_21572, partial [Mucuna pruriens]
MLRNPNAFINDIIVKTPTSNDYVANLTKYFSILREHSMRLNPFKVTPLDGFTLLKRIIEVYSNKCMDVFNIKSPKTVKDLSFSKIERMFSEPSSSQSQEEEVTFVLVRETRNKQHLIYFTSRVLQSYQSPSIKIYITYELKQVIKVQALANYVVKMTRLSDATFS